SRDGRRAAVSNLWDGSLTLLEVDAGKLRSLGAVTVGHMPRGIVFAPDGKSLYVALAGADEVAQVDWQTRKVLRRLAAPREPRRVALTKNGRSRVAVCMRSSQVRCWDTDTGKLAWERGLTESFSLLGVTLTPDDADVVTTQVHHRQHPIVKHNIEQG